MRGGWRRRRVVGVVVAFILVAMLVAGLVAHGGWPGRRDETRRKNKKRPPRRVGPFSERVGDGKGWVDVDTKGDEDPGEEVNTQLDAVDSRTVEEIRVDSGGEAETTGETETVERERGELGGDQTFPGDAFIEKIKSDTDAFAQGGEASAGTAESVELEWWEPRTRKERALWHEQTETRNHRRRLIDPGGDGEAQNEITNPSGASCVAACGLCRASCCCDSDCRAVGDCCFDFEEQNVCVEQKHTGAPGVGGTTGVLPPSSITFPPTASVPPDKTVSPPSTPATPALPEATLTWPPFSPVFMPPPVEYGKPVNPPPPPPPPPPSPPSPPYTEPETGTGTGTESVLLPPPSGFFPGTGTLGSTVSSQGISSIDPRGTWHSDVRPPVPMFPSLPPAPFPPLPGFPPVPLGMYAKLQAVPRCEPFCNTRAPPPSLPKGDRHWPKAVAYAAEKQWQQIKDLAQIQIGGSLDPKVYGGSVFANSESVKAFGDGNSGNDSNDVDTNFFFTENLELKKHMRRVRSLDEG